MKINIHDSTKIRTGKITLDGKPRTYVAFVEWRRRGIEPPRYAYSIRIVIADTLGSVRDSISRDVGPEQADGARDALRIVLNDLKAEAAGN